MTNCKIPVSQRLVGRNPSWHKTPRSWIDDPFGPNDHISERFRPFVYYLIFRSSFYCDQVGALFSAKFSRADPISDILKKKVAAAVGVFDRLACLILTLDFLKSFTGGL